MNSLSPKLRVIQQSWITHLVIAALLLGGSALFDCFKAHNAVSLECLKEGLKAAVLYLVGVAQHSPGSASFNADGTVRH